MTFRRKPLPRRAAQIALDCEPAEASDTDSRIAALTSELVLLKPYASSKGLGKLRSRVAEIERQLHRLRGLPLEEEGS